MARIELVCLLATFVYYVVEHWQHSHCITDMQTCLELIEASIEAYPGSCPCPYNVARDGSRCGERSAYSRPGGYSPLCYPSDITAEILVKKQKECSQEEYQKEHACWLHWQSCLNRNGFTIACRKEYDACTDKH